MPTTPTTSVNPPTLNTDYNSCVAISKAMRESNDCSVIAVSLALDIPYTESHTAHSKAGRLPRRGTRLYQTREIIESYNHTLVPATHVYALNPFYRTIRSLVPVLPHASQPSQPSQPDQPSQPSQPYCSGKFLIFTSRHVATVINGRIYDWTEGRGHQVNDVYEVRPPNHDPSYAPSHTTSQKSPLTSDPDSATIHASLTPHAHVATPRYTPPLTNISSKYLPFPSISDHIRKTGRNMLPQSIPSTRKFWLAFRAEVYAELERQGIKRTTASIILGQWQKEIGYDMRFLK